MKLKTGIATTIPYVSRQYRRPKAGAWSEIEKSRISHFSNMRIWENAIDSSEALHFSSKDVGTETLGCIVENVLIRSQLKAALEVTQKRKAKITWYCPERLSSIDITESNAHVKLQSEKSLNAKLVIAADGANSISRKKLNLLEASRDYSQYGLVAQLHIEKPHLETAYQRFFDQDVLGILPLANGQCSMVWSCAQSKAEKLLKLSDKELGERITAFSQSILGTVSLSKPAQAYPLQLLHSRQYVSERVVLCGDAAHAVHPLAGQGLNLGLLDAAVLCEILTTAWKNNFDLGDLSLLRQYERKRKMSNVQMMSLLDGLLSVFQSTNPIVQQARRVGMGLLNQIKPLKGNLIEQALGLKKL